MRPGQCCALNMSVRSCPREGRQVMCPHLRRGLVTGGEFDQRRFAESCPEEANAERHTRYYAGGNLNNGITWRRGQPRRSEDEMIAIDQVCRPSRVIGR